MSYVADGDDRASLALVGPLSAVKIYISAEVCQRRLRAVSTLAAEWAPTDIGALRLGR